MEISEIFYSVQGEGVNAGLPSVFLRLAVCNLHCSWCDTKYTWDWKQYDYSKEVRQLDTEQIREQILKYDCKHLVITGGEPMLQQEDLARLSVSLKKLGFEIEIETNGTILPNDLMIKNIDQWNVSPKTSNSGNSVEAREKTPCYQLFKSLPNAYFKYVVETKDDLNEIMDLVTKYHLPPQRVILMPEGTSEASLQDKSTWLVEICERKGFRFSTRLHIILYGSKRAT